MYWLTLVSGALCLSITEPKAAVRNSGDKMELEYSGFNSPQLIGPGQILDVRFDFQGEGSVDQAFVSVQSGDGKARAVPAKVRKNTVRASVPFEGFHEGESLVRAYVASGNGHDVSKPLVVTARGHKSADPEKFDPKKKFAEQNEITYEPKPEILHQFRPPPRMVSAPVAIVFAVAVWALFLGLVSAWKSQIGLKFGGGPFVASLAAIEVVFLGYYYNLSIFNAIFFASILSTLAGVLGIKTLKKLPDVAGETKSTATTGTAEKTQAESDVKSKPKTKKKVVNK